MRIPIPIQENGTETPVKKNRTNGKGQRRYPRIKEFTK